MLRGSSLTLLDLPPFKPSHAQINHSHHRRTFHSGLADRRRRLESCSKWSCVGNLYLSGGGELITDWKSHLEHLWQHPHPSGFEFWKKMSGHSTIAGVLVALCIWSAVHSMPQGTHNNPQLYRPSSVSPGKKNSPSLLAFIFQHFLSASLLFRILNIFSLHTCKSFANLKTLIC